LIYHNNPYDAAKSSAALVILTEWNEFKQIDLQKINKIMKKPLIFDGRNIYETKTMKDLGFTYFSVGRKPV
ncbi:UDP-glucose 6-dehydrogenase, partial [Candidatus Roizmanbacteria bacterium]|nr:UDP-glucose 6-dehydrogenase [Candidatus Roizmanbacteria bacterium]